MELLAPAGGMDSLLAAVRCGADAVYLGLGTLNARRGAQNFDARSLLEAARICNERGVKIHLALNTLAFDDELDEAARALEAACEAGVAALLVQDLGIWALARACAPELPLHASTQMAVHDVEGVLQLASMGFSRAVLARELTLGEIGEICRQSPIETEAFVHGALCMSLSGRCLFSAMAGGRSGNRGMCAQPCRLPMTAGKDNGYALSLRDLSLLDPERLRALEEAGVCSLKIEGRMKRPEYVAAAVTAARRALAGEKPDLAGLRAVFSRSGFTDGYFTGRRDADMFGIRTKEDVLAAPAALEEYARLAGRESGSIPLDFTVQVAAGVPASLTAADREGHEAAATGPVPEEARTRPTSVEDVERALSKLGGTCYALGELNGSLEDGLTLPAAALNAMRRDAVEEISRRRGELVPLAFVPPAPPEGAGRRPARRPALRAALARAEQYSPELAALCETVALYPDALQQLLRVPGLVTEEAMGKLALREPSAHFDDGPFLRQLDEAQSRGIQAFVVCSLAGVRAGRALGMRLLGDFALNVTNSRALEAYERLGVQDITLSVELSAGRIARMGGGIPRGVAAYGRLPLMVMRCCPVRGSLGCVRCRAGGGVLRDREGRRFAVSCESGAAQLLNCDTLWLGDKLRALRGADFAWLYFADETRAAAARVAARFAAEAPPEGGGFTRGLVFRKVQ